MSKLNFLVFLNAYNDLSSSNAPSLSSFKWDREMDSIACQNPLSSSFSLAPGETKSLFSGVRILSQNNTTQYSIALKPLNSSIYILSAVSGALPNFRTPRASGADATTQISITQNGPLLTLSSTSGTPLSLISGGAVVGDLVRIGDLFNQSNQGEFKILSLTATSLTIENELGVIEGPITLGAGFASQLQIYSAAGVQVGDTLVISGGFSPVTQASYKITSVAANFLEFSSLDALPQEGPITTQAIAVYSVAKRLVYLESDQNCSIALNGVASGKIEPLIDVNNVQPGVFLNSSTVYSMSVTNNSTNMANLFLASVE